MIPLLEPGDYIIDGGNSFFEDTERRSREALANGVKFLGMGISGGEEGALLGPSLMPGLTKEDWGSFESLFGSIAAKDFAGMPCVTPIGPGGAGHYVKMVHNGIEYAMMQLIAEIYDFNRKAKRLSAGEIGKIFDSANSGKSASFLAEITAKVLAHRDAETEKPLVDFILDKAAQKGTGGWTSIESIKLGAGAEMSIVGPRAYYPDELENQQKKYVQTKKLVSKVLSVRPGITGLWQVSGRSEVNFDKRIAIDAKYVDTMSLWNDLVIIAKTPLIMLTGKGAV
jgi:6-phosphogluconate dehydrogenase (decarboxylating)